MKAFTGLCSGRRLAENRLVSHPGVIGSDRHDENLQLAQRCIRQLVDLLGQHVLVTTAQYNREGTDIASGGLRGCDLLDLGEL